MNRNLRIGVWHNKISPRWGSIDFTYFSVTILSPRWGLTAFNTHFSYYQNTARIGLNDLVPHQACRAGNFGSSYIQHNE